MVGFEVNHHFMVRGKLGTKLLNCTAVLAFTSIYIDEIYLPVPIYDRNSSHILPCYSHI